MEKRNVRKPRLSMLWYYPIVLGLVVAALTAFALLYSGGGAKLLENDFSHNLAGGSPAGGSPADGDIAGGSPADGSPADGNPADGSPAGGLASGTSLNGSPASATSLGSPASGTSLGGSAVPESATVARDGRLLPYKEGMAWGYKDVKGLVAIPAQFYSAQEFSGDAAFAADAGTGLYGLIDRNGNWMVAPCWDAVRVFSDGRAAVSLNDKWGYIDQTGKLVVDYLYREAGEFSCGRARVRTGSFWGYIDMQGDLAITASWIRCYDFAEDKAFAVATGEKYYIIDRLGEKIATLGTHVKGETYSQGYAAVNISGEYNYYNSNGRTAYKQSYQDARAFSNDHAAVKKDGLWGFITTRGYMEIEATYAAVGDFNGGYAAVKDPDSGLWGYIDAYGVVKIDFQFTSADKFSSGVAIVEKDGAVGITDVSGNFIQLY